jgi:predicted 3-demethylubiquinone-9 3-methyltransferase (glyoxalase superfamily)
MITVTPFLWFDDNADAAVERYLGIFPDTELLGEQRMPDGTLFLAEISIQGQRLTLMNGGPQNKLNEAFSLAVSVETQEEVDRISDALLEGGGHPTMCGWLDDAFGLTWQIVPTALFALMGDPDPVKAGRVRDAMLKMQRLNIQGLQDAYDGKTEAVQQD